MKNEQQLVKDIFAEIINVSGGIFEGSVRLYNAFVFAHQFYYIKESTLLSEWPVYFNSCGYIIKDGEKLSGEFCIDFQTSGSCSDDVFISSNTGCSLSDKIIDAIKLAVLFVRDKSKQELLEFIMNYSNYEVDKTSKEVNIYTISEDHKFRVFLRDFMDRRERYKEISKDINEVFGSKY